MLAPPNHGSEVVDKLKNWPGFGFINGPAGRQLGTGEEDMPQRLGDFKGELGIIAGTRTINLILSQFLPNPDDGKVSLESTKLEGMCSFVALPSAHPFLMRNERVIKEILNFLATGTFYESHAQNQLCHQYSVQ